MLYKSEILQKFRKMPDDLQIVCIGTTQAHFALDFTECPVPAFNMALYLNPIIVNRFLLEKYQNKIGKNAVILITLQYPILCIDCLDKIVRENAVQYAKILPGRLPHVSMIRQMALYFYPSCFGRQFRSFEEFKKTEKRNAFINHYKPWELKVLCENLVQYGWEREIGVPGYVGEGHKSRSEKADTAMRRTTYQTMRVVRYCQEMGWKPVLIGLPYSDVLNQYIPDSFKEKCFYRNIKRIQEGTSCDFMDYSADDRIQDINNYMDVWFLNKRGRQKFTRIVLDDLKKNSAL